MAEAQEAAERAEAERVAKQKQEEEQRIHAEAEDAFAIIGDLDNALKAFQGALGLDVRSCGLFVCVFVCTCACACACV